ncbi:sensor domain-containing diguanylate cyclase [Shewanella aestuarii]|uniref:Sensor domain-containing diguanylate cyclase n=1 Tax=Shewanella aestuarii TaxID=1028752 RepID=A0A6G9QM87_9GAMM|nr:sensor domain-containing diguanylate cyclase [Shewanella aestuarii]QIR15508.1 sensor domain-containing diguanylate cyclase [Shewanella aestuarii]
MVGRNPVFLKDEVTNKEYFWGFVSALLFLDDLLSVTELNNYEQKGYAYRLSRKHPDTGEVILISTSKNEIGEHSLEGTIEVPNGEWYLQMSDPNPLPSFVRELAFFSSLLVSLFIVALLRKILNQPRILKGVVETQTRELQHLAHHDPLTKLSNRSKLKEAVERALSQYKRYRVGSALLIIDLDNFKPINDICGHDVGDTVLKIISDRIRSSARDMDTVARMGEMSLP